MNTNFTNDNHLLSLKGKNILVTGVSRSKGIGASIAEVLAMSGANVIVHGYSKYDEDLQYKDTDENYVSKLQNELASKGYPITVLKSSDLSKANVPQEIIEEAVDKFGYIDGLVVNHAYSTYAPIGEWTADHIDAHFAINVRATMLLIQAFSKQLPKQLTKDKGGSITLFTSGQYLGPMLNEIAYAVSKDAIIGLCKQLAEGLSAQNIRVNCINPGPTDTGYLEGESYAAVAQMFPSGRWGMPEDAARLVRFLQSDDARWITGQVIASEGGFRRYRG